MNEASPLASLTPVQIKQLQRVFYALDKNADGRVSDSDVAEALRNLGVKDAEAEAKTCFEGVSSSTYDTMSFLAMMSGVMEPFSDTRKLSEAFESFDEKDEGFVDVDMIREILDHNEAWVCKALRRLSEPVRLHLSNGSYIQIDTWLVPSFLDRTHKRFDYRKFLSTLGMCEWKDLVA